MSEERLGSGLTVTSDWDIKVDQTGDLDFIGGSSELQKDLAIILAVESEDLLGGVIDNTTLKKIEVKAENVILSDERIESVPFIEAQPARDEDDTVVIAAQVVTSDKQNFDLVFNL